MSVSKIFSILKLPLLLSFIAVSLLACDKMVIGTSTGNMEVKELSEKEKLEQKISTYKHLVKTTKAARDKAYREIQEAKLELKREKQFFRNEMNQHWSYRAKPGDHNYRLCNGIPKGVISKSKHQGNGTGGINCSYEADLYMAENVRCAQGNICGCRVKGRRMDDSCMNHKAKKKVIEEKIRSKTIEYHQHRATLMRSDKLPAMKKEVDAAQKRLAEIEEAEKAAQAAEQLATKTAVEAYTEEPRWDGATDYSQSCSPSSGDLNCGGGVE
jgi:hypothetical protein